MFVVRSRISTCSMYITDAESVPRGSYPEVPARKSRYIFLTENEDFASDIIIKMQLLYTRYIL